MIMERSRSKRNYNNYYQDYENDTVSSRTKPRYNYNNNNNNNNNNYNRYPRSSNPNTNNNNNNNNINNNNNNNNYSRGNKGNAEASSMSVTTSYRILCHDAKAGGVIGKGGGIIKQIRQHTGAWVNVHELVQGDEERIIEISDTRRRDLEGRMPPYSPAEAALLMIHERILLSEPLGVTINSNNNNNNNNNDDGNGNGNGNGNEEGEYHRGFGGVSNRVATRMVVSRMHVGCLLGKGGKIIEQMRVETKTQIRILPRDHTLPRCVSMSEEIVQVVGEMNNVKHAIEIIAARLRESQHRDRSHLHGRLHSDERFYPDDDYVPHMNNAGRRSYADGPSFGSRLPASNYRSNNYSSRQSGYSVEAGACPMPDAAEPFCNEDLVFRVLCAVDRVHRVVGESNGIVELLQNEIGVDVKISEPVSGSDEQIIIISSSEGPDDELFPAQEALLHIQTCIVDLAPDQDNIVKTRLLVPSSDIRCLEGRDGSLSDLEKLTGAKIQIITRDKLPACVLGADELVQIEGEIKAARDALVEVTSRLRSYIYKDFFQRDTPGLEAASPVNVPPGRDGQIDSDLSASTYQSLQSKDAVAGMETMKQSVVEAGKKSDSERREDVPAAINRIAIPLVTRSTLEVVIPEHAVPKLLMKSKNKLAQISELSGASVTLVEDIPDVPEKIIQLSGTPEQVERAQSLLQGFILSTLEDGP